MNSGPPSGLGALLLTLILLTPGLGLGNDAAYRGEGATVFAYKEQRIRMRSEHIRIRRAPDDRYPGASWVADCRFEFENLNDSPVTIQMGFPDRGGFPSGEWTIKAFEASSKGKRLPVQHKTVDPNHGHQNSTILMQLRGEKEKPLPFPKDHDPDGWRALAKTAMKAMNRRFAAAYTWPVSFGPRERVVVQNSYRFGGAGSNGPITVCLEGLPMPKRGGFWYALGSRYPFGSSSCSVVTYVVTTGRSWHGSIGEAVIEIEIPDYRPPNHIIPLPPATEVTEKLVRWRFTNFKPSQELRVLFAHSRHFDKERQHGYLDFSGPGEVKRWLEFAAVNGASPGAIARMRDLQAYSFGLRAAGAPVPSPFRDGMADPKAKKPRTRSQLSPVERQILDRLDEAVKRAGRAQ